MGGRGGGGGWGRKRGRGKWSMGHFLNTKSILKKLCLYIYLYWQMSTMPQSIPAVLTHVGKGGPSSIWRPWQCCDCHVGGHAQHATVDDVAVDQLTTSPGISLCTCITHTRCMSGETVCQDLKQSPSTVHRLDVILKSCSPASLHIYIFKPFSPSTFHRLDVTLKSCSPSSSHI